MRFFDEENRGNDHFGFRIQRPSTVQAQFYSWRDAYFADTDLLRGPFQDPDNDGLQNFLEYVFDEDPSNPSGRNNFAATSINHDDDVFILKYTKIEAVENTSISYQYSVDLSSKIWTTAVENMDYNVQSISPNGDGTETIIIHFETSGNILFLFELLWT